MAQVYRLPEPAEDSGRPTSADAAALLPLPARPERDAHRSLRALHSPVEVYLNRLSPDSRRGAGYRLRMLAGVIWPGIEPDQASWHEMDAGMLMQLRARLVEQYKPATAINYYATVRGVLKACWLVGVLDADTYERLKAVPAPTGTSLPPGRYVDDDEWARLFQVTANDTTEAGLRDLAALALLRGSGCRRHELVALDVSDVDLQHCTVKFRTAKGGRQRESAFPEWVREPLAAYLRKRGFLPGPLFFRIQGKRGMLAHGVRLSTSGLHRMFKHRAAQAGMPELVLHDTRRGYITSALDAGIDTILVARQVGHAQVETTRKYDRRPLARLQEMSARIPSPFQ